MADSNYRQQDVTVVVTEFEDYRGPCSPICNLLWVFFGGGLVFFFLYGVVGCVLCITIVGIPLGLQFFKLATLAFLPFGRELTSNSGCGDCLLNILWLPFGIIFALFHVLFGLLCCITIVGIPFGLQHFKLMRIALVPCGREITTHVRHTTVYNA
eukprot:NODE_2167_length_636_cov_69.322200_g2117_i0.p1 GENE.NODE_2167_length_636_cov_69.322200_g2117_i0~~NODE_2167_length_636_cov_69.322200_g2117_i0.p1  ORF type:complete len:173 (-),score=22.77 NODE_2167_length_636_cov_69.322200_g2117_i0:116-580(-)